MPLAPGSRLGPYEILAALGAGGMGEVYRARDPRLGREIAIKVLPADVADRPDRLARLEREARTVAALNHPNIVTLHSFEEAGGVRFLTLELVEGRSLDRVIAPGGLAVERVLDLALPLADAVAAAHERGIVHRDLKPGNVMVTDDGRVKVLDFGLARPPASDSDPELTQAATVASPVSSAGDVVGTVPYMAPEQLRGEVVDARADLFSLGILLFELLTGARPFAGATQADVTSAILRDPPPPLAGRRPGLPRDLERIVSRCLEKDPRDRFQTARDVFNELRYLRREGGTTASAAWPREAGAGPAGAPSSPPSGGTAPPSGGAPGATPSSIAGAGAVPSIAVLPFANRSRDEEDEYFSDGLADELLNVLAKIRGLRVAARTSSFQFKGRNEELSAIGAKLNVATVLEGSVRRSGPRVRITVQLVNVADGFQRWSETYDRTLEDIFAVQDEIAQSVVKELRAALMGGEADSRASGEARAEVAAAAKGRGAGGEAHRLFLQGRHLVERLSRDETARGIEYLRQAVELDPGHALAWVSLARGYSNSLGYGWSLVEDGLGLAHAAARRALEAEPDLAEGHAILGRLETLFGWNWEAADAHYRRALELAPSNVDALQGAAALAQSLGRAEEALRLARRAVELDPLAPGGYSATGHACRALGRPQAALEAFRKVIELAPMRAGGRMLLAVSLLELGRSEEAMGLAQAEPEEWARECALAILHHAAGRRAESDGSLSRLIERHAADSSYQIAAAFAFRGEADQAFRWLDESLARRDPGVTWVKLEPLFAPLRGDPRWKPFLEKLNLPA